MDSIIQHSNGLFVSYAAPGIKSLVTVLFSVLFFLILSRVLKNASSKGYFDPHLTMILGSITKLILVVVVILLLLGYFGVSVGTLWAVLSGILALVALGFVAVWSVLSNVLCSVLLIIFPPFRIGDEIEIQEPTAAFSIKGKVIGINMLMTSLEVAGRDDTEAETNIIRVPNNIFFQKYVRCIPGKGTQSLKKFIAEQQENS